ncbi:SOS response-associated peptidase [Pelatocladus sp. BLCC-F211]|uniref:SOS response-associated peptidase n=1 Tax=Pelatocladus sp. BLCC-F211 TaxID=3342752 RepID=UPI0035B89A33
MCGRFTLSVFPEVLTQFFEVEKVPDIKPQYNIAPTQMVLAVLYNSENHKREIQQLRWGLIPSWAKDQSMGAKLINARAETVAEKPAFRRAFKHQRCLVVADGFYEWRKQDGKKQPYYFHLLNGKPFAFAGLWEEWQSPEQEQIKSCTILTTQANELLQQVHDRMPVILQPENYDLWLDPQVHDGELLQPLLHPYPSETMTSYPVTTLVNSPKNNSPECITSSAS